MIRQRERDREGKGERKCMKNMKLERIYLWESGIRYLL